MIISLLLIKTKLWKTKVTLLFLFDVHTFSLWSLSLNDSIRKLHRSSFRKQIFFDLQVAENVKTLFAFTYSSNSLQKYAYLVP